MARPISSEAVAAGAGHWRLHLLVFGCTFVMFPLLGMLFKPLFLPAQTVAFAIAGGSNDHRGIFQVSVYWPEKIDGVEQGETIPMEVAGDVDWRLVCASLKPLLDPEAAFTRLRDFAQQQCHQRLPGEERVDWFLGG